MSAPLWFSQAVALRRQQYLATLTPYQRAEYLKREKERQDFQAFKRSAKARQLPLF